MVSKKAEHLIRPFSAARNFRLKPMAFDFKTGWSRAWTGTGSPGDGSHRFAANGRSAVGRNSARWLEFVLKLQLGPRREFRSCRRLRADASSRANRCQPDDR